MIAQRGERISNIAVRLTGLLAAMAVAGCTAMVGGSGQVFETDEAYDGASADARPWTSLDFVNDPENFQFAVITDRTGGHRPGVFPAILAKVNLMQPEFVMSVGDYIEGYTTDKSALATEWREIDGMIAALEAPLFFVVGNHDVSNSEMEKLWRERAGRTYYHFLYRDVLFLALSTEDPPYEPTPEEQAAFEAVLRIRKTDGDEAARKVFESDDTLRAYRAALTGGTISDAQRDWALDVLAQHSGVRWTFVFMHKPVWQDDNANFAQIEETLAGRGYTMLAGHVHNYQYNERHGQDYMRLGTTGGGWGDPKANGNMDHITWVTMRNNGPVFAHLVATGLLAKDSIPEFIPGAEFCGEYYGIPCVYGGHGRR